ncbi:MAG: glycosyltransferase [Paraglaciecola sp.]|uniref:glycosyltransferase n=1 Tax=Paraglaciecola sp. TaxID=1920173 RepID=UPI00273F1278|nr:glycosyltransferase family 2 protein [Paraglaciecola sp.]MDP5031417.1 glycosyltransferase [Paraglaciecola sp.]MDP5129237.1 glycosyltransferase [Paraglaciecola sp.]
MTFSSKNFVSFIIPHKGRFEMLKQTLESIVGLDYPRNKFEIIVVSQTPETQTEILINEPDVSLKVLIQTASQSISASRNIGVKAASGDFLAFLDADIALSANWVVEMHKHLSKENRIIVSAMQVCDTEAPALEKIRTHLSNAELDCNLNFLPGRNLFMTRNAFEKIGGFPEHLITCEDYYFTDKAAKLGDLYYTSDASYIHIGEDKVYTDMFKKEIWRGQSNLQSIKGRKIPLREIPSFIIPIAIFTCLILSLFSVLFLSISAALIFLILGMLPVVAYSMRLYSMAKNSVSFGSVLTFYTYYFPARAIGTVAGLFKAIGANHK